ncbi:MAG TPA: C4-type zinc ribbon domain-containing protein [Pirellulales bacterium]|jgi:hypothetical protein|nr:C4-type zinc ribbon domain-containing protein [Pirellulales bacterium]
MAETGALLRDLHRMHQQLEELRQRFERGPRQVKVREANVAKVEAELNHTKADVKAAKIANDQKQLQLKSGESKIADLRVKLNQANSNREYQAFKDQIAADEMAGSVLADEILEGMERIEALQKIVVENEQKLAKAKEELGKSQAQVRDQGDLIAGDVTRIEAELKQAETNLPSDFAEAYRRMVRGRGADALAQVEGEHCGGCNQVITPNVFNNLLLGKTVISCQTCGRILYLPEDRTPGRGK